MVHVSCGSLQLFYNQVFLFMDAGFYESLISMLFIQGKYPFSWPCHIFNIEQSILFLLIQNAIIPHAHFPHSPDPILDDSVPLTGDPSLLQFLPVACLGHHRVCSHPADLTLFVCCSLYSSVAPTHSLFRVNFIISW